MTVRHILLALGAVLVLGMAVYLVYEVSRPPASAQASSERVARRPVRSPAVPAVTPAGAEGAGPPRAPIPEQIARRPPAEPPPPNIADPPASELGDVEPGKPNPKLDALMSEANKAYDRGDFDEAKAVALKVLGKVPNSVRMLRILVSADCILGDATEAQKHYLLLPQADRAQMQTRCDRYGVTFKDP